MRTVTASFIVGVLSVSQLAAQPVRPFVGRTIDALVVRIADGDTLEVVPTGQRARVRVRLEGVDAPELGEVFSREAQVFVRRLLFDQHVRVVGRDIDRFDRLVARVEIGGRDVSLLILEAGLACHRFAVDASLAAAEARAQAAGRGFWAPSASKPQCVARSTSSAAPTTPRSSSPRASVVRGNTSSKLYHLPSCPNFRCRNCSRVFASEAEARAAGFTPAGDCAR